MFALVVSSVNDGVWAVQGRRELVLVKKRDIRLRTRTLILLVVNEGNSLEFGCHDAGFQDTVFQRI